LGGERSEFESPDANVFSEGLEGEEEEMKKSTIPSIKTNIKEGRIRGPSLEEFKSSEVAIMRDPPTSFMTNDP
jgi:hypothetical protein